LRHARRPRRAVGALRCTVLQRRRAAQAPRRLLLRETAHREGHGQPALQRPRNRSPATFGMYLTASSLLPTSRHTCAHHPPAHTPSTALTAHSRSLSAAPSCTPPCQSRRRCGIESRRRCGLILATSMPPCLPASAFAAAAGDGAARYFRVL
jgi:hypothetical protein